MSVNKNKSIPDGSKHHYSDFRSAISFLRSLKQAKFNESVDVAINLSNKNKSGSVKGFVHAEHSIARTMDIIVFSDEVIDGVGKCGGKELIDELVKNKKFKCDVCISHPKYLPTIMSSGLARILGMRKIMPDSKLGTVGEDVQSIVSSFQKGVMVFRSDKFNTAHCIIGKLDLSDDCLEKNFHDLMNAVSSSMPQGMSISSVYLSTTMGKGSAQVKWQRGAQVG